MAFSEHYAFHPRINEKRLKCSARILAIGQAVTELSINIVPFISYGNEHLGRVAFTFFTKLTGRSRNHII